MSNGIVYSRGELLDWLNSLLDLHYTKVEEVSNGAAFCQILDVLYPGQIKLHNVNYNATTEPEIISNYKIIQSIFTREHIERNLPVQELSKGKPMVALQILQWFKPFFDEHYNGGEYDGQGRRDETRCANPGERKGRKATKKTTTSMAKVPPQTVSRPTRQAQTSFATTPYTNHAQNTAHNTTTRRTSMNRAGMTPAPYSSASVQQQINKMKEKVEELKGDNKILLEERDFYYQKLQSVEALCQQREGSDLASKVLEILYQTDEERGFVSPDQLDI